jgi:quercetin dioxygenase-like cupin family protein
MGSSQATTSRVERATLIRAAEIPQLDRGGVVMSPLATPAQQATEVLVLRGAVPPGLEFPAHSHDRQEVLLVVRGSARATIGDEEHRIDAGDVLLIPGGAVHGFVPLGEETLEAIGITPAGTRTFLPDGRELPLHGEPASS